MNRIIFSLVFFVACTVVQAQEAIQFKNITLAQAKVEAKASGKLIFLDGYTSWCAPCKWMESNVFNQVAVAQFYNSNFINTKFDCEIGEGVEIAKTYGIRSFPTYLFLDGEGTLVYRTQSRMEADKFLAEGRQALNKDFHIPTIQARFLAGEQDPAFLLRYITVMAQVDPKEAQRARAILDAQVSDEFLKSDIGWEAIQQLAQNADDTYGKFFMANRDFYKSIASPEAFSKKELQLLRYAMYSYIRTGNKEEFEKGLAHFEKDKAYEKQIDAAMFRIEWIGSHGTDKEFIKYSNELRKGLFKQEDERLSFIARRFSGKYATGKEPSEKVLKQCYVLAKQAVVLNEMSYSNQGTFAEICILLKKKNEAVKAAEAARGLAELETSKIIKIADALLDRAKAL